MITCTMENKVREVARGMPAERGGRGEGEEGEESRRRERGRGERGGRRGEAREVNRSVVLTCT